MKLEVSNALADHNSIHDVWSSHEDEEKDDVVEVQSADDRSFQNDVLLRGLNEGLADFWGWLYTEQEAFISFSLPREGERRKVSTEMRRMPVKAFFKKDPIKRPMAEAYNLGIFYSRFMRNVAELEGKDKAAQRLVDALPKVRASFEKKFLTEGISPNVLIHALYSDEKELSVQQCCLMNQALEPEYDDAILPASCPELEKLACD